MPYRMFLFCTLLAALASASTSTHTVKVKIDAPELDKAMLLSKLNANGSSHGMRFEVVEADFDYRVEFGVAQGESQALSAGTGGSFNTSQAKAKVFDSAGKELFEIVRAQRWTDSGAANAVSKEIIKRLQKWESLRSEEGKK